MSSLEQILNYRKVSDRLATGGKPTAEQIAAIANAGFETLVNLALSTSEAALPDEAAIAARHGLEYLHLPLNFEEPELVIALEFVRVLRARRERKVFVHYALNQRVSALIYAYRVSVLGDPIAAARTELYSVWQPNEPWQRLMGEVARLSLGALRVETPRLLLREIGLDDAEAIQTYASDPRVCRFMVWGPNSLEQTRGFCSGQLEVQRQRDRRDFELAIVESKTKTLVGGVGIRVRSSEQREGDIGYVLRHDRWGQGLVAEAAQALLLVGFGIFNLHRIYATADTRNVQSLRVMEKLGMTREGTMRGNLYLRDAFRDTAVAAILEHEFWSGRASD